MQRNWGSPVGMYNCTGAVGSRWTVVTQQFHPQACETRENVCPHENGHVNVLGRIIHNRQKVKTIQVSNR